MARPSARVKPSKPSEPQIRRGAGLVPSREAILEASRRLYAASDYTGVTMRAVAKEVGCRSPSLYHYFTSKEDIFRALVNAGMTLFDRFMPTTDDPDPVARLRWRFWRYYEFSKAHPEYFRLLFVERSSPVGDETLHARVFGGAETSRLVETCIAAGHLPPGTSPVRTAVVLCCAMHGAAVMGMRESVPFTRDFLAQTVLQLAIDGVRAGFLQGATQTGQEARRLAAEGQAASHASKGAPVASGPESALHDLWTGQDGVESAIEPQVPAGRV